MPSDLTHVAAIGNETKNDVNSAAATGLSLDMNMRHDCLHALIRWIESVERRYSPVVAREQAMAHSTAWVAAGGGRGERGDAAAQIVPMVQVIVV
jgi:hypothetical protein